AMGRAIVRDPKIFLFDEPLSNLDAKLRVQMRTEIKRLHRRVATTVVYVTHDQVEAMTLADRIVIMRNGAIEQVGTPDEIYNRPRTSYVAGFIGSPTMNLVPVKLAGDGSALLLPDGALLRLSGTQCQAARAFAGQKVLMGLRPEDFHAEASLCPAIDVVPDVIEPLGSDTLIFFTLGASEVVARLPPRHVDGRLAKLRLHLDLGKLHLFDAASGKALWPKSTDLAPAMSSGSHPGPDLRGHGTSGSAASTRTL
ncbi:MAG: ABC transporter ATP-binding protein, partial [Geminicoccaceae bacterium]